MPHRLSLVGSLALLLVLSSQGAAMDRITGHAFATRSEVLARHAMVATSQPLATQAGLEILRRGGNAVDAAIAANAVLALVEPTGCGLGGDLFAIVWDPEAGRLRGLNGSGRSPGSLTLDHFRAQGLERVPPYGPLPVTVPGCVDGWFTLHAELGRLPMTEVLAPAIRYAREGFPVTELIAHYWELNARSRRDQPGFAATFLPDGRAPRKGEVFRNPGLAATLEELGDHGRDAFYEGRIAGVIADQMAEIGGFLGREDLAAHRSEWVDPVSASYRGVEVWELPPNGQGIAALQILNVLEGFDVAGAGFGSADHLHWFVEAKKLAFADRARYYADMDVVEVPVQGLISKEYAAVQRERIDPARAARAVDAGNPALESGDTVYLAAADESGLMVSLIQSNYRGMGSGVCPPGLGFGLQDRGELFDLAEGRANTYAPGKRPFHTIIPAFLTRDGEPWCAFGVMGGATQPQAHAWVVMNIVDFGMNLQEAGDAPRVVHRGSSQPTGEVMTDGGTVYLETGFSWENLRELENRGHRIGATVGGYGGYQAVMWNREQGVFIGASESRKDGHAAGF
jgi:gamma-glutamyltranspeptidase/glutathione hydrolase